MLIDLLKNTSGLFQGFDNRVDLGVHGLVYFLVGLRHVGHAILYGGPT